MTTEELTTTGHALGEMVARGVPKSGINLWRMDNVEKEARIYVLGTAHGLKLSEMGANATARRYLVDFLQGEHFTHIYTETIVERKFLRFVENLSDKLEGTVAAKAKLRDLGEQAPRRDRLLAEKQLDIANVSLGGFDLPLDEAYLALASARSSREAPEPKIGALETSETRDEAHWLNIKHMGLDKEDSTYRLRRKSDEPIPSNNMVIKGNQEDIFREASEEMVSGRDIASAEQRNKQWMEQVLDKETITKEERQLWIVGAVHIPGLVLRFQKHGWRAQHMDIQ